MATTKETAPASETKELTFSDLVPSRVQKSAFPLLKELDGQKVRITDVGQEGKVEKQGFYLVLQDGSKRSVPFAIAKKAAAALANAKAKGQAYVPATVTAMARGVRLS